MKRHALPIVLAVALVLTGVWGYNHYAVNRQYGTHMDNIYQKSFYELVGNVGSVESRLGKLMVSGDQSQHMMLLSEICRQADAAQTDLGQLPISHLALMKTARYLNQLSDYTYFLSKKVADGQTLSVEEMDNLRELHANSVRLSTELNELERSIQTGGVRLGELAMKAKEGFQDVSDDIVAKQFVEIERTSIDYPALIYDGPFSETLTDEDNPNLSGDLITQKQAETIAVEFVGEDRVERVSNASQGRGDIETWGVFIETQNGDGPIYVAVTKKGGKILNMIGEHGARETRISLEDARDRAKRFLSDRGYPDMVSTYQQFYDGVAVINFAYQDDDIVMYPDLIKVKIAMDDGVVLGFEARNYLVAHRERNLDSPKLTMEDARRLVNPNLNIVSERMAVIPTESRRERFCYEFKGEYGENNYIIYIDANTGEEADILQIIDTENGSLTI